MIEFGLCAVTGFPVVGTVYNNLCGELRLIKAHWGPAETSPQFSFGKYPKDFNFTLILLESFRLR
jgi:hypothetical protein